MILLHSMTVLVELMLVGWRELGRECVRDWLMYFWGTGKKRYMVTTCVDDDWAKMTIWG